MHDITIIVPTYWGRPQAQARQANDGVFDHPTPIDGESTLPRLLDSLAELDDDSPDFQVLILVASVHIDIDTAAMERMNTIIANRPYPIYAFGTQALNQWKALLQENHAELLGMDNYARIRNNQLFVPHVMGSQIVVALDDDEVVEPDYLKRAVMFDKLGIAGIYINPGDTPFVPEQPETGNAYRDKAKIMNDALRQMQAKKQELVPTVVAYGGNMVFRRDLWEQVPFDPGITRGEDIDYVLNAKLAGIDFYLDEQLKIIHLPPHHYNLPPYIRMSEDVRRFVYEAQKVKHYATDFTVDDLMPYPGKLMSVTDEEIKEALNERYTDAMPATPDEVIAAAYNHAEENVRQYADFLKGWRGLCAEVKSNNTLTEKLLDVWLK